MFSVHVHIYHIVGIEIWIKNDYCVEKQWSLLVNIDSFLLMALSRLPDYFSGIPRGPVLSV